VAPSGTDAEEEKQAYRVTRSYVDPKRVGTKKPDKLGALPLINEKVQYLTPEGVDVEEVKEDPTATYIDPTRVGRHAPNTEGALPLINQVVEHLDPVDALPEDHDPEPIHVVQPITIPEAPIGGGSFDPLMTSSLGSSTLTNSTTEIMSVTSLSSFFIITILLLSVILSYTGVQTNSKPTNNSGRNNENG